MRKIVAFFCMLAMMITYSTTFAFNPGIKSNKERFNEKVTARLNAKFEAAVHYNKTHTKKNYYIKDDDGIHYFMSYLTSSNAGKLFDEEYYSQKEVFDTLFNEYIAALRSKYLPEKYKDYQIYFMLAGMFYTPDITKSDVNKDLDWSKVRSLSFDKLQATYTSPPYATNTATDNAVRQEFTKKINIGIYNNLKEKFNIVVTDKTIIVYKWLLFDLDIKDATLESFLKEPSIDWKSVMNANPPQPVIFMSEGLLYNSKSSAKDEIDGLSKFLVADGDYSDIISVGNSMYQRNKLMKDITNAFVYFYQKDNSLIPSDFCSRSEDDKKAVLAKLAASYQNAPTGTWETAPFRNPVLFVNIDWNTRKCIFDYLLGKTVCSDAKGATVANACEEMLIDAIGAAKGADQKNVLDYFNDPANYKKLYEKIDDAGGGDNYTGVVLAFCKLAASNGYWDTQAANPISNALFNFHNTDQSSGPFSNIHISFDQSFLENQKLHFEIVTSKTTYVSPEMPSLQSEGTTDTFSCTPFTPVQFVYSDKLEFAVQKADGTTPEVGEIITVPALYLQWIIHTDFKMTTIKAGQTVLLVGGLISGVGSFASATSLGARLWAAGDIFFTSAALLSSSSDFRAYIKDKWGDDGLEVLGVINTVGMWYGGAYLGKGAIEYLSAKMEQQAFKKAVEGMMNDAKLTKEANDISKAAGKLDEAGSKLANLLLEEEWQTIKKNIIKRCEAKAAESPDAPKWILGYTDAEIQTMVAHGKNAGVETSEIEDIIMNGCRPDKDAAFKAVTSMTAQMDFWLVVKQRGYPNLFANLQDFQKFSGVLKKLAKDWGLPEGSIYIQGSSLRMKNVADIGDIDIAIKVDDATFEELAAIYKDRARNDVVKSRIGAKGKIGGLDMKKANNEAGSFTGDFYPRFQAEFGQTYQSMLNVPNIQISVIKEGGSMDISPYLNCK